MEFWQLLVDAAVLLGAALVLGAVMEAVRQSAVVGYLLAGVLVGPGVLGLVHGVSEVQAIAELGVALLLFSIGLEFSVKRLRALGWSAFGLGVGQVTVTLALGGGVALALGFSTPQAVGLGAVVALSSTAVVLRVLVKRAELDSVHGRMAVGVLLVQDTAVIPLILLVTALSPGAPVEEAAALGPLARLVVGLAAFVGFSLFGRIVLPALIRASVLSRNQELPILFGVVVVVGAAWVSHALGVSPSLGAFAAGVVLGGSPVSLQIRADVAPLKVLFVTLFFASVGMFAEPLWMASHALPIALTSVALVVGKALAVWPLGRVFGLSHRHAIATGICIGHVGEFSFVLAGVALGPSGEGGLFDADLFSLLVSATIVTLMLTPSLVLVAPAVGRWVESVLTRRHLPRDAPEAPRSGHAVIVGFGPAGRAVADAAAANGHTVVVLDLSPARIDEARRAGYYALLGDASSSEVLGHVHVGTARTIVLAVPDHRVAEQVISGVRTQAPNVDLIVRSRYHRYADHLTALGATAVVDEEQEVGLRLAHRAFPNEISL